MNLNLIVLTQSTDYSRTYTNSEVLKGRSILVTSVQTDLGHENHCFSASGPTIEPKY